MGESRTAESRPAGRAADPASRLLQRAAALYARGNLHGAEAACRELLRLQPTHADALHVLGLVAFRRGEPRQALDCIRKAIAADPDKAQAHNSLGVVLKETGDLAAAELAFRAATALQPRYPEALTNLGNILGETGRLAEAETMHRQAVEAAPNYAEAHNNLATALARQERWDEALEECRLAVAHEPNRADFQVNLGNSLSALKAWEEAAQVFRRAVELNPGHADAHANLGIALYHLARPKEAEAAHRAATRLRPDSARIWVNLAAAQNELGDSDAALESCRKALELDPYLPEAHNNTGLALANKGMNDEALSAYRTALELRPYYYKALSNLGSILQARADFATALQAYSEALDIMPHFREAQWNKGVLQLLLGDFESGWLGYERGLEMKHPRSQLRYRRVAQWDGSALAGKTILISGEQGVGDQIMFGSLLPDLVERGARVILDVDKRLHPLLHRSVKGLTLIDGSGPTEIDDATIDFQAPIGSLCRWLRPHLGSFPLRPGYLVADRPRVEALRKRYRNLFGQRPIVGLSWRGGFGESGRLRSIPLSEWSPILQHRDFGFVSLQYGDCRAELAAVRDQIEAEVHYDDTVDSLVSLDDFAVQTSAMDLVISIDNSTVHMAGALDVPVWVLLPVVPDWRWMLKRTDSPWYSSARLFRQTSRGDWLSVLAVVADELRRKLSQSELSGRPPVAGSG
jgi:tetratricopeptide (TPR) repeat protein